MTGNPTERPSADALFDRYLVLREQGEVEDFDSWASLHPEHEAELRLAMADWRRGNNLLDEAGASLLGLRLTPGTVIGDYELLSKLGRGGQGTVWKALQRSLGRHVALKLIDPGRTDERTLAHFEREAKAGGRLVHPSIVTTYAHGETRGLHWIAQEPVGQGRSLRDHIEQLGRAVELPPEHYRRSTQLIAAVAEGLQAAHEAGVIHRDIKPANILLTPDGQAKVSDFGLARLSDDPSFSMSGEVLGTYLYMSPEQIAGKKHQVDHRTDVFSLGVVLYELLALVRPFDGDTTHQIAEKITSWDPPSIRGFRSRAPEELAVICAKALEKRREDRYPTMEAFAADLRRYLANEPILARPAGPVARLRKWVLRNPYRALAGGIAGAAFLAISTLTILLKASYDENLSLAAGGELEDLATRADELWPPVLGNIGAFDEWIEDAKAVIAGLAGHRERLQKIRARALPGEIAPARWRFVDRKDARRHDQLSRLVAEIETLEDPERGLLHGISETHGWGIARRRDRALAVFAETIESPEAMARWEALRARLSENPDYANLVVPPQEGLVPIGPDPDSGLEEFGHPLSGAVPERGDDDRLTVTEETGLVFVLLPGGVFTMGAQSEDPAGPNYDEKAQADETPHPVKLTPFFLSKYEATQGQWKRLTGANPSYDDRSMTFPVEQVTWYQCVETCSRFGLALPSEAQWEYAARGGSDTVWWTGSDRESLRGAVNLADQSARADGATWAALDDWKELNDGHGGLAPVDAYRANPFGLHNVHGNVWEWCQDAWRLYSPGDVPEQDPVVVVPGAKTRVARGGCFEREAALARSANRFSPAPGYNSNNIGIRPARALEYPY